MSTRKKLSTSDLTVLSMLLEQPMHGYGLVRELERQHYQDWAPISRSHVYYSLKKLEGAGLTRRHNDETSAQGPDRDVFKVTEEGREKLASALGDISWVAARPPWPFLTWLAICQHTDAAVVASQIAARMAFLSQEIAKEAETRAAVEADPGPGQKVARITVEMTRAVMQGELDVLTAMTPRLLEQLKEEADNAEHC